MSNIQLPVRVTLSIFAVMSISKGMSTSFVMLLVDGNILLHIIRGSQDYGDSLVDVGGLDVQNVL